MIAKGQKLRIGKLNIWDLRIYRTLWRHINKLRTWYNASSENIPLLLEEMLKIQLEQGFSLFVKTQMTSESKYIGRKNFRKAGYWVEMRFFEAERWCTNEILIGWSGVSDAITFCQMWQFPKYLIYPLLSHAFPDFDGLFAFRPKSPKRHPRPVYCLCVKCLCFFSEETREP
jgi:hypothetical protein